MSPFGSSFSHGFWWLIADYYMRNREDFRALSMEIHGTHHSRAKQEVVVEKQQQYTLGFVCVIAERLSEQRGCFVHQFALI